MLQVAFDPYGRDDTLWVSNLSEAMQTIKQRFPNAVHRSEWQIDCSDYEAAYRWHWAMLEVWPDQETMDMEQPDYLVCALIFSDSMEPPEPGALLYVGRRFVAR